ncbi:MAG: mechanosensitive ion channel family protein [Desulfovibrionaceae bacterium]
MPRILRSLPVLLVAVLCAALLCARPLCAAPQEGDKPAAAEQSQKADGPGENDGEADKAPEVVDPWQAEWDNQKQLLTEISNSVKDLTENVPGMVKVMNRQISPYRTEMRRLFVLTGTYSKDPRTLEAVKSRLDDTIAKTRAVLAPVEKAQEDVANLKEQAGQILKSLPQDSVLSKDMRQFGKNAENLLKQLNTLSSRIDSALEPGRGILKNMTETSAHISDYLPKLWSQLYIKGPQNYWSEELWTSLGTRWSQTRQLASLRMPLELPDTSEEIWVALFHAGLALLLCALFTFLLRRRIRAAADSPVLRHIFRHSIPWLCLGIMLLASSWGMDGNIWHLLMALGNMALIVGQVSLSWDLRRMYDPSLHATSSPMWQLVPLTLMGYVLLYPNLPFFIVNAIWIALVAGFIVVVYFLPDRAVPMEPDNTLMRMQPLFLWVCLILAVLGMATYSMILYMLYLSITVALQLSMGSMQVIHFLSEKLPKNGIQAALGSLAVALAAPAILLLVIAGMSLWICTLPGGLLLVKHYAGASVGVGNTSFSFLSLLLIISVFYLTRAAVSLGETFLSNLARRGSGKIDSSLIPSLQTAFTYAAWALFGLFVLRSLGLELSNLAMVAGGLSVGIGFGMQTIINNFLSGLILIFSRTLQEGDIIEVGGLTGTVRKISVRATMVETYDSAVIYVPNSEFVANRLINWTRNGRNVRREIIVGVAYGSDPQQVMKIMREAAAATENVMKYPVPGVLFKDFSASTLDFTLRYWVRDFNMGAAVDSAIRMEIEKRFKAQGIEIAFPQLDVHLKDVPPRALPRPRATDSAGKKAAPRPLGRTAAQEPAAEPPARFRRLIRRPARPLRTITETPAPAMPTGSAAARLADVEDD